MVTSAHPGTLRLFRFAGIQVYLHWSWFVVAVFEISSRVGNYSSPIWNVAEYLMLFVTVTLHEFGHALACRQTGGQAHEIVLWPLGGIAFVAPPPRPGATLWSIAAGPLVNVALAPIFFGLMWLAVRSGVVSEDSDGAAFLFNIAALNVVLLVFNLLPIYPLDGGQILRSLLWFGIGRARSLYVAATIGIAGVAVGVAWRVYQSQSSRSLLWTGVLAVFLVQRCLVGFREAKVIAALERMPRHTGFACPTCHNAPPGGPLWICRQCRQQFDPFSTNAICPHCQTIQQTTVCAHCGADHPIAQWRTDVPPTIEIETRPV